jgi:hypothetical protein
MIIAIDFDGTIVEHKFPDIGREVPGAFRWMKEFQDAGARLILFTMRSDLISEHRSDEGHKADQSFLSNAVEFCRANGIEFWGVNCNPEQHTWTLSPKPYAHVYIDDAAFGCPLREAFQSKRQMADWSKIGPEVMLMIESHKGTHP